MNPPAEQAATRRIVVILEASESGRPALETAARLASILDAELEGIFVEDVNLIRTAELPFLRELRLWSHVDETLDSRRMQRELRTLARHAERMLEQAARDMGVNWSFRVWRGRAQTAELLMDLEADILSLGRISSLVSSRLLHAPLRRTPRAPTPHPSIHVLFSDSEQAPAALAAACHLASNLDTRLTVLLPARENGEVQQLRERARSILDKHGQQARFIQLREASAPLLAQTVCGTGDTVLIAEADHPLLQQAGLDQCLEALACPILLVR